MTEPVTMHIKELKSNPWGAYLILVDDSEDWHLPVGLRPTMAESVKDQLRGGGDSAVPSLVQRVLGMLKGNLKRVEIAPEDERGYIKCSATIEQEGAESTLPVRLHDGALLARRAGVALVAHPPALARAGIRSKETLGELPRLDQAHLSRFTMGCLALGRLDEGIESCQRLMEIVDPRSRDIWRTWMGDFYRLKGWSRRAAEEYAAGIAWEIANGDHRGAISIAAKMAGIAELEKGPIRRRAPALIEDFEGQGIDNVWSGHGRGAPAPERMAGRVYLIKYDLEAYAYPWLHLMLDETHVWEGASKITFDTHLDPESGPESLEVEIGVDLEGLLAGKYIAPPVRAGRGWSSHALPLRDQIWKTKDRTGVRLDADPLEPVTGVQFIASKIGQKGTGTLSITNIRLE